MKKLIIEKESYIIIKLFGKITLSDTEDLRILTNSLIKKDKNLVFDLRNTKHVHYSFVKFMGAVRNRAQTKGLIFKIICKNPYIISIFNFIDFNIYNDMVPNLNSIKKSIKQKIYI